MDTKAFQDSPAGQLIWSLSGRFWTFRPNPLPPRLIWSSQMASTLSEADRALGELAGLGRSLPNPHLLIRPFTRREAVLSSRIEGTLAQLTDLYAYEAEQLSFFQSPSDVREIHNYVRALEYGLERMHTLPVSLRLARELHALLMEDVRGQHHTPGEFRRSQNWIGAPGATLGQATYVPPTVTDMQEALGALEKYIHASPQLPPLIRLGLIHYQFEAIHPFLDGNGRIGRLLISLLLCSWGLLPSPLLYLSVYFEKNRQTYYDRLLAVSRDGEWEAWLMFFLDGVAVQAQDALFRGRKLQDLREAYRAQFQSERAAARLLKVIDLLFSQPIVSVRQVEMALDVNFPAAHRYVKQLEQAGVLREITGKSRNRVYQADSILSVIEESS